MGPLGGLMGMMPGMPKELKGAKIEDDDLKPIEAIITLDDRSRSGPCPTIINGSRRAAHRRRIGDQVADVNRLVKQFGEMQKMMKKMGMRRPAPAARRARRARRAKQPKGRGCRPGFSTPNASGGMDLPGLPGMPNMPGMPGAQR